MNRDPLPHPAEREQVVDPERPGAFEGVPGRLDVEERLEAEQRGPELLDEVGLDRGFDDRVAVLIEALGVDGEVGGVEHGPYGSAAGNFRGMAVYALGDRIPHIDATAYVHPDATVIGTVTIGPESTIWPQAVLRGDYGSITVGARTSIQDGSVIHTTEQYPTVIGDDCVIGHLVHIECCTIEDRALVGSGSVVLHRVIVRSEAVVGANAVVPNDMEVPSRAMALGVPAKLRLDAVKDPDEVIGRGARNYVRNGALYRAELRRID